MNTEKDNSSAITSFDQLRADITLFVEPGLKVAVDSQESCANALSLGKQIKGLWKQVEEKRKSLVEPLNERVKQINSYAKGIQAPLTQVEEHLRKELNAYNQKLLAFQREETRKAEDALKKAEAEARARAELEREQLATVALFMAPAEAKRAEIIADTQAERSLVELDTAHKKEMKSVSNMRVAGSRIKWKFDVKDETLLPREFLMVDDQKIRKAVEAGLRELPGVHIYETSVIALGS